MKDIWVVFHTFMILLCRPAPHQAGRFFLIKQLNPYTVENVKRYMVNLTRGEDHRTWDQHPADPYAKENFKRKFIDAIGRNQEDYRFSDQ